MLQRCRRAIGNRGKPAKSRILNSPAAAALPNGKAIASALWLRALLPIRAPRRRALRLAVQDTALSRLKHGFDSRRARQIYQWLSRNLAEIDSAFSKLFPKSKAAR